MIFAAMFIACADNNVCVAPEYTQPVQDTTSVQDTTYTQPIQDTIDTYSETPVYYRLRIGEVCTDMNVQSTGILNASEANIFDATWMDKCVIFSSEPASYIKNDYKLNQIVTILMDNLSFDSNMVNSLLTEVNNSGSIVYFYNTNSGLNFLYIRRLEDN